MEDREKDLRKAMGIEEPLEESQEPMDPNEQVPIQNFQQQSVWKRSRAVGSGWYRTKINLGFWLLVGGLVLFLLGQFILRPMWTS